MSDSSGIPGTALLPIDRFQELFDVLRERGFRLVGPVKKDEAIVYEEIDSVARLPRGWTDEQDGGSYRLVRRGDDAFFGYTTAPQSWKRFLHPPRVRLWEAHRTERGFVTEATPPTPPRYAFIGVRPCELAAIGIQDRVFLDGRHVDSAYRANRTDQFLIVVQCGRAGGTCFCASMGTGPKAEAGYDLALTEILDAGGHRFLVEIGSDRGREVVEALALPRAEDSDTAAASRRWTEAASTMGRELDTTEIREVLARNPESPVWDRIAETCMACGNCTMVCPTCFCTTVEDLTDLTGSRAERVRRWDSCFTVDFSYIHGGSVRTSARARYRQWLTHKLAHWHDQFGSSGCVGCGRCITWCPVGIDITRSMRALRAADAGPARVRNNGGRIHGNHQDSRTDPVGAAVPEGADS